MKPTMSQTELDAIMDQLQEAARALRDARSALNQASWRMEQPLLTLYPLRQQSDPLLHKDDVIFLGLTMEASGVLAELSQQAEALRHRIGQYRRQLKDHPIAHHVASAARDAAAAAATEAQPGGAS